MIAAGPHRQPMPQSVEFTTKDGVKIAGTFHSGRAGGPAALLLHMMPATKESWDGFARLLARAGFAVLAIDLRGHGESRETASGERLDYKLFEDRDHQAKIRDVEAAAGWLADHQAPLGRLVVIGASIGANLAIAYAAAHPRVLAVAALSPGLDYRGVTTPDKVRKMASGQSLFLAASAEDELSFKTDRELAGIKPDAVVKEYDGAGHGTGMFAARPELMAELAAWLVQKTA